MKRAIEEIGGYFLFGAEVAKDFLRSGVGRQELCRHIVQIGTLSLPIVLLTALFTGMVLALQTAFAMERFGAKNYVGNIVGIALSRELGPVLSSLMVCGRVGAGIAAEIGTLAVTEQIDAMRCLGANPIRQLVTPRVLAALIALPGLVIFADLLGIYGGFLISVLELDISGHLYYSSLISTVTIRDFTDGLVKSSVFGALVVLLACFNGIRTTGGTVGVGQTTTKTVVIGSIIIFITDFFLTKLFLAM
ncbi:ABC transporter permease [bacterium]|jgi:phospholipid/cholesterol/gamma-HCH transport system permease protein|nr:ABC transporter permease [bacterium]